MGNEKRTLSAAEATVSDVVGRLIEFWGFKKNMGRVWSVLYLSEEALSAEDLRDALSLSSGAMSMTLTELARWGVVRKVWVQGERKDFYAAEVQLWRMISRVWSERERLEIKNAIESFEDALSKVDAQRGSPDPKIARRAELQYERIRQLLELSRLGQRSLEALLSTAKLDRRAARALSVGLALGFFLAGSLVGSPAQAQPAPVVDNSYALELFQGPIIAPNRITGMAGAYTALADDVDGVTSNAAAPAVREPFSKRWFDLSATSGISLPGGYAGTDFTNRGENAQEGQFARTNRFLYANIGGRLQFGSFGIVATGEFIQYAVSAAQGDKPALQLTYARTHTNVAYGFWDNQLVIGTGFRGITARVSPENSTRSIITMTGFAPEVGMLLKPNEAPFRIGATVRSGVTARPIGGGTSSFDNVVRANDLILPERILQPWEFEAGIAWQFGARPLNPRWINPHEQTQETRDRIESARKYRESLAKARGRRPTPQEIQEELSLVQREEQELADEEAQYLEVRKARYQNWPREHLLFLTSVLLTGPSKDAVALEGMLDQKLEYVGRSIGFAPRVGVEAEPLPNRARVRFGGYLEPSRFADGARRQHFTIGTDIRLFAASPLGFFPDAQWAMVLMFDLAPRYQNYGIGISAWH